MNKIICLFPLLILMSSCSEMNSQFDCPMKPGIRCESIDSVNARIDRGEIGQTKSSVIIHQSIEHPIYKDEKVSSLHYSSKGEPLRYGETVQRVWIAPFEDKEGNYHQANDIYIITKPGKWIGAPLTAINEEE